MKERFPGWFPREPAELAEMWNTAVFVPDANVLLHCIRHPAPVRDELLRLFTELRESLWIPYQVGLEFHRNRLDVELGARDTYKRLTEDYQTVLNQAREKIKQTRAHPVIDLDRELAAIDTFLADFETRMVQAGEAHPSEAIEAAVRQLTSLFEGRVGEKWPADRMAALKKEGEDRYARKVPPGYKDAKKDGDGDKFGDLIIWRDMMEKARADKRPVIFISDDVKEDWWWLHRGRKLGPRPELVEEFRSTTGEDFHIYEFTNFLRVAAERHPELVKGVEVVEQSLRGDERARRRRREADDTAKLYNAISDLEDERERVVQILSGSPSVDLDRSSVDRASLKTRLEYLNVEIRDLGERLSALEEDNDEDVSGR